ncbi:MAG: hypothetical protein HY908_00190 [Myxococcales bacterium]|nr:hypothetical protein [Myxococcales bacterium]
MLPLCLALGAAGCSRSSLLVLGDEERGLGGPLSTTSITNSATSSTSSSNSSSSTTSTITTTTATSSTGVGGAGGANPGLSGSGCAGPTAWAKQVDRSVVYSLAANSDDEVAATGKLFAAIDMGGGPIDGSMFAVRLDADASHLWSQGFGQGIEEFPGRIVFEPLGGVVVGGTFTSTIDLASDPIASAGWKDGFTLAFDASGTASWASRFGDSSPQPQFGNDTAVDAQGNVASVGSWGFGGPEDYYAYVEKRGPDGGLQWTAEFGHAPSQTASALGVAFDSAGNVIVAGGYRGEVDFGGGPLGPEHAGFLVKLAPDGAHLWSVPVGGIRLAVDGGDNLVVTGTFREPTDFGGGVITPDTSGDIYVVRLDGAGQYLWAKAFGGVGHEYAHGLAVDRNGNILLTGSFSGTFDFGAAPLTQVGSGPNIFVAGLDPSGGHLFSLRTGDGTYLQEGIAVTADTVGSVLVGGRFSGVVDLGNVVLDAGLSSRGFIAKLGCGL